MSARLCMASVLVALAGCTEQVVVTFEPPSAAERYSLFVAIDTSGTPVRAGDVYGVEDGRVVFGGAPRFRLDPGEEAVVVSFGADALGAVSPGFLPDREAELRVRVAPPPDAPRLTFDDDPTLVDAALPEQISVRAGAGEAGDAASIAARTAAVRAALTLTLPIDPEYCRPDPAVRFVPFAEEAQIFPTWRAIPTEPAGTYAEGWRKIREALFLTPDLVFALTHKVMFVIERGDEPELPRTAAGFDPSEPAPTILVDTIGTSDPIVEVAALDPTRRTARGEAIVVAAGRDGGAPAVWELAASAEGLVVLRRVPIEGDVGVVEVLDVVVDARGTTIVVGASGLMLVRRPEDEALVRVVPPVEGDLRRIIDTGDSARPHLLAEDSGRLVLGDVSTDRWQVYVRSDRLNDRRFYGLAAAPGGQELWAVGPKGTLFRSLDGPAFAPLEVPLPPSAYACGSAPDAGGLPRLSRTMMDVQLDDDAAYLLLAECSGIVRVRRSDLCSTTIEVEGFDVTARQTNWRMRSLRERQLLVFGDLGELRVADLDPD